MAPGMLGHLVRCAAYHELSALFSPFRAHVDDPVRAFDNFEIMFDDDEGISAIAQPQEHFEQFLNIRKMQPRCRFVEQVECAPCSFFR